MLSFNRIRLRQTRNLKLIPIIEWGLKMERKEIRLMSKVVTVRKISAHKSIAPAIRTKEGVIKTVGAKIVGINSILLKKTKESHF